MNKLTMLCLFTMTAVASAQWSESIDTVTTGDFNDIDAQVDHAGMVPGSTNAGMYGYVPGVEWLVFERWSGTDDAISACMFSDSTLKWDSNVVAISPEIVGVLQKYPDICTVGNGTSIAAWQEKAGTVWNIYTSIHATNSAGWSDPTALTNDTVSNTDVEVRPLSDSSLVVIWKRNNAILFSIFKSGSFSGINTLVASNTVTTEYDFAGNEFVWTDTASSGNRFCLVSPVENVATLTLSAADTITADGDMSNPRFMILHGRPGQGFAFNLYKDGRFAAWEASLSPTIGWSTEELAGSATASYLNGVFYVPMQVTSAEPGLPKAAQAYLGGSSAWEKVSGTDTSVVFIQAASDSIQEGSDPTMSSLTLAVGGNTYVGFAAWQSDRTGRSRIYSRSFLWKLDAVDEPAGPPTSFRLDQNYPNPFNPTTNIEFRIANFGFVSLKVYDVLGRLVATLVNGVRSPGSYEVQFNGSKLASGVYFYRLTAPGVNIVRKMLLEK